MSNDANAFNDVPVIGRMASQQVIEKLRELDDLQPGMPEIAQGGGKVMAAGWWPFGDKPWCHTAHSFGFLSPAPPGNTALPIVSIGNMAADQSLRNSKIKIVLNGLRVADYPGRGTHRVLFDFYAQNQVTGGVEHIHFNSTYRVREGERAAIIGYPIFVGLNVGGEGVAFKCFTVNVSNDDDEALLAAMEGDVFRAGLKLATTFQPAIAPLSGIAIALTKSLASRNRNVAVQDFYLGLDFTNIAGGARLAEGTYIAVQIPESMTTVWSWRDWVYDPGSGQIVNAEDSTELIPFNCIMFSVSRYDE